MLRGRLYGVTSGADGLFVPCLTLESDIEAISKSISLPLNVMCMPNLPKFERLGILGVKRISMGDFIHSALQTKLRDLMLAIQSQQTFAGVFVDESSR